MPEQREQQTKALEQQSSSDEWVLSDFDLSNPKKAARVGDQLIDEMMDISELHPKDPKAAKAQGGAAGNVDVFFEIADLGTESQSDHAVRERIQWANAALEAWVDFVADTGMVSHDDIQDVLNRLNLESDEGRSE